MATFTQHKDYGPLRRQTLMFEGESLDVVRGDLYHYGRKYTLRRTGSVGTPDAHVFVTETGDSVSMMKTAIARLGLA